MDNTNYKTVALKPDTLTRLRGLAIHRKEPNDDLINRLIDYYLKRHVQKHGGNDGEDNT